LGEDAWSPPGSGLATSYDSLNVFLTSAQQKTNFTVSTGPGLLTQEPGSTVKHLNWPIPACIPPGQYELTLCESSHINGTPHFSITALPLEIENDKPIGQPCTSGLNDYQQNAQASSPPPTTPSVSGKVPLPNSSLGLPTSSPPAGGLPGPGPTPSSIPPRPTSSKRPLETSTSVVGSGQGIRFTTVITDRNPTIQTSSSTTFTTVTTDLSDGSRGAGNSGFFPVNRGKSIRPISESLFAAVLWSIVCAFGWILH